MQRKVTFQREDARADLPYSPVVQADGVLYLSGQVPVDPSTKQVVDGGILEQTRVALENVRASLALAGATLDDVVKVNVYLTNMDGFADMNTVYREYFPQNPPARTTTGTSGLAHPSMLVEIDVVALAPTV